MKQLAWLVVLVSFTAFAWVSHEPVASAADTSPQLAHDDVLYGNAGNFQRHCANKGGKYERKSFTSVLCYLKRSEVLACVFKDGVCQKTNYRWPAKRDDVVDRVLREYGAPDQTVDDDGKGCYWGMWKSRKAGMKVCAKSTHLMHETD